MCRASAEQCVTSPHCQALHEAVMTFKESRCVPWHILVSHCAERSQLSDVSCRIVRKQSSHLVMKGQVANPRVVNPIQQHQVAKLVHHYVWPIKTAIPARNIFKALQCAVASMKLAVALFVPFSCTSNSLVYPQSPFQSALRRQQGCTWGRMWSTVRAKSPKCTSSAIPLTSCSMIRLRVSAKFLFGALVLYTSIMYRSRIICSGPPATRAAGGSSGPAIRSNADWQSCDLTGLYTRALPCIGGGSRSSLSLPSSAALSTM